MGMGWVGEHSGSAEDMNWWTRLFPGCPLTCSSARQMAAASHCWPGSYVCESWSR